MHQMQVCLRMHAVQSCLASTNWRKAIACRLTLSAGQVLSMACQAVDDTTCTRLALSTTAIIPSSQQYPHLAGHLITPMLKMVCAHQDRIVQVRAVRCRVAGAKRGGTA